uniref:Secreted protein n=1 Tax=Opuntia streptacantha TaxID=393608 RepID=A0A7C9CTH3_OPUST
MLKIHFLIWSICSEATSTLVGYVQLHSSLSVNHPFSILQPTMTAMANTKKRMKNKEHACLNSLWAIFYLNTNNGLTEEHLCLSTVIVNRAKFTHQNKAA